MGLEVPAVVGTVVTGIVLAWLIFIYLAKPIAQSGEAVENDDVDEELLDTVSHSAEQHMSVHETNLTFKSDSCGHIDGDFNTCTAPIRTASELLAYSRRPTIARAIEARVFSRNSKLVKQSGPSGKKTTKYQKIEDEFTRFKGDGDKCAQAVERPKLLLCHDMKGNYLKSDKYNFGGEFLDPFPILYWQYIDIFCYFSHELVSIPPLGWINTCRRHGSSVLGTFITEWEAGEQTCKDLFYSVESSTKVANILVNIAEDYSLDGWLVNIENSAEMEVVQNIELFVAILREGMKRLSSKRKTWLPSQIPGSKKTMALHHQSFVVWYDAMTTEGNLKWQNDLTDFNKPFFDSSDAIFINYTWKVDAPAACALRAGALRRSDVFMGCDVFGRNTYGGGKFECDKAMKVAKRAGTSFALFAPSWIVEDYCADDAKSAYIIYLRKLINETCRFWRPIEKRVMGCSSSFASSQRSMSKLNSNMGLIVANFSLFSGSRVYVCGRRNLHWNSWLLQRNSGKEICEEPFFDLSLQDSLAWATGVLGQFFLESCESRDASQTNNTQKGIHVHYSTDAGYNGAGCLVLHGILSLNSHCSIEISHFGRFLCKRDENNLSIIDKDALPSLPASKDVVVRMALAVSTGNELMLRLVFWSPAERGNDGKPNYLILSELGGQSTIGTSHTYCGLSFRSSGNDNIAPTSSRISEGDRMRWEVREFAIPAAKLKTVSSRNLLKIELICVQQEESNQSGTHEFRAYIGHISIGSNFQMQSLSSCGEAPKIETKKSGWRGVQRVYTLEASLTKVGISDALDGKLLQFHLFWGLSVNFVTTPSPLDNPYGIKPHFLSIDVGHVNVYACQSAQIINDILGEPTASGNYTCSKKTLCDSPLDGWVLIGHGNGPRGGMTCHIPPAKFRHNHEGKTKLLLAFAPTTVCMTTLDHKEWPLHVVTLAH
jgi:hypothetical protein